MKSKTASCAPCFLCLQKVEAPFQADSDPELQGLELLFKYLNLLPNLNVLPNSKRKAPWTLGRSLKAVEGLGCCPQCSGLVSTFRDLVSQQEAIRLSLVNCMHKIQRILEESSVPTVNGEFADNQQVLAALRRKALTKCQARTAEAPRVLLERLKLGHESVSQRTRAGQKRITTEIQQMEKSALQEEEDDDGDQESDDTQGLTSPAVSLTPSASSDDVASVKTSKRHDYKAKRFKSSTRDTASTTELLSKKTATLENLTSPPAAGGQTTEVVVRYRTVGRNLYECEVCRMKVTSSAWRSHRMNHLIEGGAPKPFKCKLCPLTFLLKISCRLHIVNQHTSALFLSCKPEKMSGPDFDMDLKALLKTLWSKVPIKNTNCYKYFCKVCNYQNTATQKVEGKILLHLRQHHVDAIASKFGLAVPSVVAPCSEVEDLMECAVMPKRYRKTQGTIWTRFGGVRKPGGKCTFCQAEFRNVTTFRFHLVMHHDDILFKEFRTPSTTEEDLKLAVTQVFTSYKRKNNCSICDRKFSQWTICKMHMLGEHFNRIATDVVEYQKWMTEASKSGDVNVEQEGHSGPLLQKNPTKKTKAAATLPPPAGYSRLNNNLFKCNQCNRHVRLVGTNRHRLLHLRKSNNVDKPIKCKLCDHSFNTENMCHRHLASWHKVALFPLLKVVNPEKSVKATFAKRLVLVLDDLIKESSSGHGRQKLYMYSCSLCSMEARLKVDVVLHLRRAHYDVVASKLGVCADGEVEPPRLHDLIERQTKRAGKVGRPGALRELFGIEERTTKCCFCNDELESDKKFRRHLVIAHVEKAFEPYRAAGRSDAVFKLTVQRVLDSCRHEGKKCRMCGGNYRDLRDSNMHILLSHFKRVAQNLVDYQRLAISHQGAPIQDEQPLSQSEPVLEDIIEADRADEAVVMSPSSESLPCSSKGRRSTREESYRCLYCSSVFTSEETLSRHSLSRHPHQLFLSSKKSGISVPEFRAVCLQVFKANQKKSRCALCNERLAFQLQFNRHFVEDHYDDIAAQIRTRQNSEDDPPTEPLQSSVSQDDKLDTRKNLEDMVRFSCGYCSQELESFDLHRLHVVNCHRLETCSKYIPRLTAAELEEAFPNALASCLEPAQGPGKPNKCGVCGQAFASFSASAELENHVLLHHFNEVVKNLKLALGSSSSSSGAISSSTISSGETGRVVEEQSGSSVDVEVRVKVEEDDVLCWRL